MPNPISHAEMVAAVRRAIFEYDLEDLQGWEARERHGNALRAVLAHLERTQWRGIESAPKDGTHILTYNSTPVEDEDTGRVTIELRVSVAYWCFGGWMEYPARPRFIQGQRHLAWMPLPPSPETPR